MNFVDLTAHPSLAFRHHNLRGQWRWVVVMRVTFDIAPDGALTPTSPAPPLRFREESFGETRTTPPKTESDLAPEKALTDVIVKADAFAPNGQPTDRFDVSLAIRAKDRDSGRTGATLYERRLSVTGPREWVDGGAVHGWILSDPVPITRVPLRYDLAYGGTVRVDDPEHPHERPLILAHNDNPVGSGLIPSAAALKEQYGLSTMSAHSMLSQWAQRNPRVRAPQIELPGAPLAAPHQSIPLAGWGIVGKHWTPRYRHAGTYDDVWLKDRHPLLPLDFDTRYWNGAHPDMQFEDLPDDVVIELQNLVPHTRSASQTLRLALPGLRALATVYDIHELDPLPIPMLLDTVEIDLLEDRLTLLYRQNLPAAATIAHIVLKEVS
jgi:hypothetical protein